MEPTREGHWPVRVLLMCADIGEGHLSAARALRRSLERREDVASVVLLADLNVMGPRLGRFLTDAFRVNLDRIGWTYDLAYRVFFRLGPPRWAAHLALAVLGGRALRRTISEQRPDVVVVDYPVLSAALGVLRAHARLGVPVCSSILDPAGLYYWAHPGIDLHLLAWPESLEEALRIAGAGRAVPVRPMIDERFFELPSREAARAAISLPQSGVVVVVSGGGWGLGDLEGAVRIAMEAAPDATVVALGGRSDRTREVLERKYHAHPRVHVLGFISEMPMLLRAADALIHTTGGTTALEARVVGCPLVNYGTGPAHVRAHADALHRRGIAERAPDRRSLRLALERALVRGPQAPATLGDLPDAAELIVELAREANQRAALPSASIAGPGA